MPTPIFADWEIVRATAIATGSLKAAADAHGISQASVRQRAHRENWPVGQRAAKIARNARDLANQQALRASKSHQISGKTTVTPVTTTSQALENSHLEHGRRGRIAASILSAKGLEHLANQDPETIVASSRQAKDLNEVSAKAGGWSDDASGAKITMNIALLGTALPDGLKGNYIFADEADIPIQIETEPASN